MADQSKSSNWRFETKAVHAGFAGDPTTKAVAHLFTRLWPMPLTTRNMGQTFST